MQKTSLKKSASTRKSGRPKKVCRPITPEKLREISKCWLRGESCRSIGEKIGVHESTVRHHLKTRIMPVWASDLRADLEVELARIAELERVAWECFENPQTERRDTVKTRLLRAGASVEIVERVSTQIHRSTRIEFLRVVIWCIERQCKIFGYYEHATWEYSRQNEFRVAGMTPAEVNEKMIERVKRLIQERREYEEALG